jgi:Tol biopolymer transport system component
VSGEVLSLGDQVAARSGIQGDWLFSVGAGGTLVYWNGDEGQTDLRWFSRDGRLLGTLGGRATYLSFDLSLDDKKVAVEVVDPIAGSGDIWAVDVASAIRSRVTVDPAWEFSPWWSPDRTRIVFGSTHSGVQSLYRIAAAGGGPGEPILSSADALGPTAWSPHETRVVYQNMSKHKIGVLSLVGEENRSLLSQSAIVETDGRLSPDARWIA